ncbi:sigma-w pathway protein ysdB [Bacillus taeanensis]|uniref:Sigma-w pathway protein ysdB n=1 Tax=Bacillus taeanensis TaxID=273032 RepID=A0A366Y3D8_9BACI|nr:sigma-w pathway protein ysdB [Bacillus taeanensis]RBW71519.1 sigma-w pathway protein ysdB [Bacillus taeanensis]
MVGFLFRFFILLAITAIIYSTFKYMFDPKRKLQEAAKQKRFYIYDEKNNVRKNFLLTYKGVLFEGEKYLGTTEKSFEVVSIKIWTKEPNSLQGFEKDDFYFIEREIKTSYPHASIEWKNPINELVK